MARRRNRPQATQSPSAAAVVEAADPVGDRLCERVRNLRKKKGWTLEQMSAACGVSRSMLSQIERNAANPTLAVAYRIAQALRISLGDLVEAPNATSAIDIIRHDDEAFHYRSDRYVRIRTLSPLHLEKDVEFYELELRHKGALRSAPHFQGARELLTVQRGTLRVTSSQDQCTLHPGDSAHYPADVPHAIENIGEGDAVAFLVVTYRPA
jgi:transcriptional regulator with XRE-family HTH domain